MTVNELYTILEQRIPRTLSCEWDNDGKMCVPDGRREVRRVLITLDITARAVEYAIAGDFDVILSHHPLIFRGMKSVSEDAYVSGKVIDLIRHGIAALSFHTRLDAVEGGVNDVLAELLGLQRCVCFGNPGEEIGRVGELAEPMSAEDFAALVREKLGAPKVTLADAGLPVKRVAVLGGSGSDDLQAAIAKGADTYVSGELKYHQMADARELGINLIEAGHFYTEAPVCRRLEEWVREADGSIVCEYFHSYDARSIG